MAQYVGAPGEGVAVKKREELERPHRYKVLLHNDHYTTMEFVVHVLEEIFRRPQPEALRIMMSVHKNGMGIAGVYVRQIAESKVEKVHSLARDHGFPLRCSMERE